jgi:ParB family transcriptional regulator, chromosome partitioning protein
MVKKKLVLANNPLLSGPALQERDKIGVPYRELKISSIERDPKQPRVTFDQAKLQELAHSIKTYGVLSPILVRPSKVPGHYTLISGERRTRAAQLAGLSFIPAMIEQGDDNSEARTLAIQLVENIQRDDLSPLERSHAIGALRDSYSLSVREIADQLGISKSMVQRSLEILELPADLLNALKDGASESKVLMLAKIEDEDIRASYLKDLDTLTRTQLEKNLEKSKIAGSISNDKSALSAEDQRVIDEIQRSIGLRARLVRSSSDSDAGRLVIDFYSTDDLQSVFRRLVADS